MTYTAMASAASRTWSPHQEAIFTDTRNGAGHTVVVARAGSGKTTTIMEALRFIPAGESTLMVAFNKSIAAELAKRAPEGVKVRTLHSFGFGALNSSIGKANVEQEKTSRLIRARYGSVSRTHEANLKKAVSLAKNKLAVLEEEIVDLVRDHEIEVPKEQLADFATIVLELLERSAAEVRSVDFDDMIWLPVKLGLRLPRFERVFIDETQDLNRCQVELAMAACQDDTRICAVGDDRQAIYSFRGADPLAMGRLMQRLAAKRLKLTVSYRCARSIVHVAREIVPDFEAAPGAPEGTVETVSEATLARDAAPGDFVLSRTNAPLVSLCLDAIAADKPATIVGRDIGAGLAQLVRSSGETTVEGLRRWVSAWAAQESKRLLDEDRDPGPALDKADCVDRLASTAGSVAEVLGRIERLFADASDASRITFSSTHKAKGLEAERVWVLRSTYRPRESTEEANLWYVAVTRAKRDLRIVEGER